MAGPRIRLDHDGIGEVLRSAGVAAAIAAKAEDVETIVADHSSVQRHRMDVIRSAYETDRAAEGVTIAHPGGLGVEAKYGVLADAARGVGLEVTAEPPKRTRRRKKRDHSPEAQRRRAREAELRRLKRAERERDRLREDDV